MKRVGIDIGSTTVKIAVLDDNNNILFSAYERHYANIQETLRAIMERAYNELGDCDIAPMITGSGGLSISKHLDIPFVQEVVSVATSLKSYAPQTDVAIELGGEDAKIIYFTDGIEQRMNGICAGGTGSFIDQMATLLKTDAAGLNTYAKDYQALYPIAARCGVFAKTDIQPLINEGASKPDLAASIFQAVVNLIRNTHLEGTLQSAVLSRLFQAVQTFAQIGTASVLPSRRIQHDRSLRRLEHAHHFALVFHFAAAHALSHGDLFIHRCPRRLPRLLQAPVYLPVLPQRLLRNRPRTLLPRRHIRHPDNPHNGSQEHPLPVSHS